MGSTPNNPSTSSTLQSQQTDEPVLEPRHKIFLSHSGYQKDFVEQLCIDLERVHQLPFYDRRFHSLPKGENFPGLIFRAARQCKLAVAVLSHEFFESKWPMLELATFVDYSVKIFPLFYKLSPADCYKEENQYRWLNKWETIAAEDKRIDTQKWCNALHHVRRQSGEEFVQSMDEIEYRKKIVSKICMMITPEIQYDDLFVQGRDRMCEIIENRFKEAHGVCRTMRGSTVIGMYGIGGTGKTTLCRSLCNFYYSYYTGKVSHMELPTDCNSNGILEGLKKVLRDLTEANEDEVLNAMTDQEQAKYVLNQRLPRHSGFLAIDNVWDKSLTAAGMPLGARCGNESKVLVTARSLEVLHKLLPHCATDLCFMPSPDLTKEEAVDTLIYYSGLGFSLVSAEEQSFLNNIVERCFLNKGVDAETYHYHPLALKALGGRLRRKERAVAAWKKDIVEQPIVRCLGTENEQILSVIRTSYDELPSEVHKHVFLDIALFMPFGIEKLTDACNWLSIMYEVDLQCVEEATKMLEVLKTYSLVEFEDSDPLIKMHDLYKELAEWQANNGTGSWCLYLKERKNALTIKDWGNLKRFALLETECKNLLELQSCSSLEFLKLQKCTVPRKLSLQKMKSLRCLEIESCRSLTKLEDFKGALNLVSLRLVGCLHRDENQEGRTLFCISRHRMQDIPLSIECLTSLHRLEIRQTGLRRLPNLHKCMELKELIVSNNKGLQNLPKLGGCSNLWRIDMQGNELVTKLPEFKAVPKLETLRLNHCSNLVDVKSINTLTALQTLYMNKCTALRKLAEIKNLENLQALFLDFCDALTEIPELRFLSNLKVLSLEWCPALKELPEMKSLVNLQRLLLAGCPLETLPDLSVLASLEELRLVDLEVKELSGINNLRDLRQLSCFDCTKLSGILDLSGLWKLRGLIMDGAGIEQLLLGKLSKLETVSAEECLCLRKVVGSWMTQMRMFSVKGCVLLEALTNLDQCDQLELLSVAGCENLSSLPLETERLGTLNFLDVSGCRCVRGEVLWEWMARWTENEVIQRAVLLQLCWGLTQGDEKSIFDRDEFVKSATTQWIRAVFTHSSTHYLSESLTFSFNPHITTAMSAAIFCFCWQEGEPDATNASKFAGCGGVEWATRTLAATARDDDRWIQRTTWIVGAIAAVAATKKHWEELQRLNAAGVVVEVCVKGTITLPCALYYLMKAGAAEEGETVRQNSSSCVQLMRRIIDQTTDVTSLFANPYYRPTDEFGAKCLKTAIKYLGVHAQHGFMVQVLDLILLQHPPCPP